ncbi:MAG: DUF4136 domain-containing protein [Planctomycetes bacterium]|nr:DUF4136 domain-containing protein [Planctomycetota bacterium]
MRISRTSISTVLLVLTGSSCAGTKADPEPPSYEVSSVGDPGEQLPRWGTFRWMRSSYIAVDERFDRELGATLIRELEEAFGRRGLQPTARPDADVLVAISASIDRRIDDQGVSRHNGVESGSLLVDGAREFDEGTLVLDVVEPRTRKLLWRGTVQAHIHPDLDTETRRARIRRAMEALLDRLRPIESP